MAGLSEDAAYLREVIAVYSARWRRYDTQFWRRWRELDARATSGSQGLWRN